MIRWYDYILAIMMADVLLNLFFLPFIGPFIAFLAYDFGWRFVYCEYRKQIEHK